MSHYLCRALYSCILTSSPPRSPVLSTGGLETEIDYNYTGHKQSCDFTTGKVAAYINSSVELSKDEHGERGREGRGRKYIMKKRYGWVEGLDVDQM